MLSTEAWALLRRQAATLRVAADDKKQVEAAVEALVGADDGVAAD